MRLYDGDRHHRSKEKSKRKLLFTLYMLASTRQVAIEMMIDLMNEIYYDESVCVCVRKFYKVH